MYKIAGHTIKLVWDTSIYIVLPTEINNKINCFKIMSSNPTWAFVKKKKKLN